MSAALKLLSSCWKALLPVSRVVVPLAVLMTAWGFSNAEPSFDAFAIGIIGILGWLLFWTTRLTVWLWRRSRDCASAELKRPWMSWLAEPVCIGLMVLLVLADFPFLIRFSLSQVSLQRFVDQRLDEMTRKGQQMSHLIGAKPERCGLFTVYSWGTGFDKSGKPMVLMITTEKLTLTDAAGFGYTQSGSKPTELRWGGPHYFDHLWGRWWRLRLDV